MENQTEDIFNTQIVPKSAVKSLHVSNQSQLLRSMCMCNVYAFIMYMCEIYCILIGRFAYFREFIIRYPNEVDSAFK